MLDLRPYQVDALDAIDEAAERGIRRPLVVHPTGSGKTVVFASALARRGGGVVLVHTDELVNQTLGKLRMIAPELSVGVVKAERNEARADVVVASVQTVQNPTRLARMLGEHGEFDLVIVDEAHHAPAPSWTRVITGLGGFAEDGPLVCGFTATPERTDGALGVWEEVVAYKTIREMILEDYLSPVIGERVDTAADFTKIRTSDGDLGATQLGNELTRSGAIGQIAAAVSQYAATRKSVCFTPTVATAQSLARAVSATGIPAEAIWGTMPYEDRRLVLKRLHTGETQFVSNCAILTEGFDESSVDCIIIARPTASHALYCQMIGRGLRKHPGKANCLVLDVVGATERHDLVGVVDLGISSGKQGARKGVQAAPNVPVIVPNPCELCGRQLPKATVDAGKTRHFNCRAGTSAQVDLFRTSRMTWLEVDGGYALAVDKGAVIIIPNPADENLWHLIHYGRGKLTVMQRSVPIDWATGVGEDHARAFSKLNEQGASWRRRPPTMQQLNRLVSDGLPLEKTKLIKTRGEAADLVTRKCGRRAIRLLERRAELRASKETR